MGWGGVGLVGLFLLNGVFYVFFGFVSVWVLVGVVRFGQVKMLGPVGHLKALPYVLFTYSRDFVVRC